MLRFKRGVGLSNSEYVGKDCYKWYKKKHEGSNTISSRKFNEILKEGYSGIIKLIVFDNFQFKMPQKLGYLKLKKKLVQPEIGDDGEVVTKRLSIDWKKTKAYWEKLYEGMTPEEIVEIKDKPLIRELNEHTDGFRVRWNWFKRHSTTPHRRYYRLKMTRANNQFLSHSLKTVKNLNYYE